MDKIKKEPLTEDTVIGSRKILAAEFRRFFKKTLGENYEIYPIVGDVIKGSAGFKGATLQDILDKCFDQSEDESLEGFLAERRFANMPETEKAFVLAFDKAMNELGYSYGDKMNYFGAIVYSKTGLKSKTAFARIHMHGDYIVLRLYFSDIDKHRAYIENAPAHIKDGFVISTLPQRIKDTFSLKDGDCIVCSKACNFPQRHNINGQDYVKCSNPSKDDTCISCSNTCKSVKKYTLDGKQYAKCSHYPGHFVNPSVERLPDYMALLAEFYPKKK